MKIIIKGIIKPNIIYFVNFSFKNVSTNKCTSTNFYMQDAFKFAEQFKKEKDIVIIMEILSEHGKEFKK